MMVKNVPIPVVFIEFSRTEVLRYFFPLVFKLDMSARDEGHAYFHVCILSMSAGQEALRLHTRFTCSCIGDVESSSIF